MASSLRGPALDRAMTDLTRACVVTAYNKLNPTSRFPRERWADDEIFRVERVLKAASSPANTTVTGWAKELSQLSIALLANLVGTSAAAELLSRTIMLNFDRAGSISLPVLTVPLADFVKQGDPIPVVNGTVAIQNTLTPSKFAVITTLTRETIEGSNAEVLVRNAIAESIGPALDRRFFDNVAATADLRPAGILNGVTPITATTGGGYNALIGDLAKLATAIAPKAGNGGITFIAAPSQAVALLLQLVRDPPGPVLTSTSLPDKTIICVANNAIVFASDDPQIDATNAASLQMDTAPVPIGSTAPVHALFQKDVLGLRLKWPIAWAVRDPAAIAFIQNTTWP